MRHYVNNGVEIPPTMLIRLVERGFRLVDDDGRQDIDVAGDALPPDCYHAEPATEREREA